MCGRLYGHVVIIKTNTGCSVDGGSRTSSVHGGTSTGRKCSVFALEVLGISNVKRCIYGDSKSALALCHDAGAWRTRHLRLRAAGLRSGLMQPDPKWFTQHVPGGWLMADCLTKPVQGQKFLKLVTLLGFTGPVRCGNQLRKLAAKTQVKSDDDAGYMKRFGVLLALLLLTAAVFNQEVWLFSVMGTLLCWWKSKNQRRDRVNEPSPVGVVGKESPGVRENEPASDGKKTKSHTGRSNSKSQKTSFHSQWLQTIHVFLDIRSGRSRRRELAAQVQFEHHPCLASFM